MEKFLLSPWFFSVVGVVCVIIFAIYFHEKKEAKRAVQAGKSSQDESGRHETVFTNRPVPVVITEEPEEAVQEEVEPEEEEDEFPSEITAAEALAIITKDEKSIPEDVTVVGDLTIQDLAIPEHLDLRGVTFKGALRIIGVKVGADLDLERAVIEGDFEVRDVEVSGKIADFSSTQVSGNVTISNVKVSGGEMKLDSSETEGDLLMENIEIESTLSCEEMNVNGNVSLKKLKVNGYISLQQASFSADFTVEEVKNAGDFYMGGISVEGKTIFSNSTVGDELKFDEDTKFSRVALFSEFSANKFLAEGITADEDFVVRKAEISGSVDLESSNVSGHLRITESNVGLDLYLSEATVEKSFDLTGTKVAGELRLSGANINELIGLSCGSLTF